MTFDAHGVEGSATEYHMGRSWWPLHFIEDECPCPKAACGLVVQSTASEECEQHNPLRSKTMREIRPEHLCAARIEGA